MCMHLAFANTLSCSCFHLLSLFPSLPPQNIIYFAQEVLCMWIISAFMAVTKHLPFQHLKDKFWNFIFYKFIFIFGVLNVQTVEEVVMWCLWFSGLVFLHLMVQLCKDRFEYVSFD